MEWQLYDDLSYQFGSPIDVGEPLPSSKVCACTYTAPCHAHPPSTSFPTVEIKTAPCSARADS